MLFLQVSIYCDFASYKFGILVLSNLGRSLLHGTGRSTDHSVWFFVILFVVGWPGNVSTVILKNFRIFEFFPIFDLLDQLSRTCYQVEIEDRGAPEFIRREVTVYGNLKG